MDGAARFLLTLSPGDANAAVLGYRSHLVDRGLSPATVNRRLAALRSLVKLGRTLGVITWSLEVPNLKSRAYRDTRGPGRPAVRAMMERCLERDDRKGVRDYALLRLLFDLGLRRGEIVTLDLGHLDTEAGTISILGKGKTQREILSMPRATSEALTAWIVERGTEPGALFLSCDYRKKSDGRLSSSGLYTSIRKIGADVGVRTRPHGLRHSAITAAVKAASDLGIPTPEVLGFSRHSSLSTLQIYIDNLWDSQKKIAEELAAGM